MKITKWQVIAGRWVASFHIFRYIYTPYSWTPPWPIIYIWEADEKINTFTLVEFLVFQSDTHYPNPVKTILVDERREITTVGQLSALEAAFIALRHIFGWVG